MRKFYVDFLVLVFYNKKNFLYLQKNAKGDKSAKTKHKDVGKEEKTQMKLEDFPSNRSSKAFDADGRSKFSSLFRNNPDIPQIDRLHFFACTRFCTYCSSTDILDVKLVSIFVV